MTSAMAQALKRTPYRRGARSSRLVIALCTAAALAATGTLLTAPPAFASVTTYYVATNGSNGNPGTLASPFQTIQKCADVAVAGDTCSIQGGTYRETVTPANSGTASQPISFVPYNGQNVVVSGANVVSGWTQYSGNIYSASVNLPVAGETSDVGANVTVGAVSANQVFVSSGMVSEASWPYTASDPSHPATSLAQTNTTVGTVFDSNLPSGLNLNGAIEHVVSSTGWTASANTVTATGSGQFTVSRNCSSPNCNTVGAKYFLTGGTNGLNLLQHPGQWWYNPSTTTLYLWAPAGGNPGNSTVEYKQRNFAFDLGHRAYINVSGLSIFAATITTDSASNNNTLNSISGQYLSHSLTVPNDPSDPSCGIWCSHMTDTGIILNGNSETLENSNLSWSAGNIVAVLGTNTTVTNNLMHDGDYIGAYPALVNFGPQASGIVSNNTIYNSGRFLIAFSGSTDAIAPSRITSNNVYNFAIQTRDLGAIYSCCMSGDGTRIDHNWAHDGLAPDLFSTGIFLDDSARDFTVDHNVIWSAGRYGLKLNASGGNGQSFNDKFYNNTLAPGFGYSDGGFVTDGTGSTFENDLFSHGSALFERTPTNATTVTNLSPNVNPQFVNAGVNDFRLQPTSPAIDAGTEVPGITDGYSGSAPDQGAYESGGTDWIAGCDVAGCQAGSTPYLGTRGALFSSSNNVKLEPSSLGGRDVSTIYNNSWAAYSNQDITSGATLLTMAVASPRAVPGTIEAHVGSPSGALVATCTVPNTAGWQTYSTVSCPVSGLASGTQTVYLVAKNANSGGTLFNLAWFHFETPPVTTLDPRSQVEAEQYDSAGGVTNENSSGGSIADESSIKNGSWSEYDNVSFGASNPSSVTINVANASTVITSTIQLRLDNRTGPIIGTCSVPATGGWQQWATTQCPVTGATGTHNLYLNYIGGSGYLMNVDWFKFS